MLVEDNPINQMLAKHMLKKFDLQLDIVADGLEAIRNLAMPVMGGLEATRRIRTSTSSDTIEKGQDHGGVLNPAVPIIAMTANAMRGDREICLEAGMDDYISKPIDAQILAEKLEKWLNLKGNGAGK